MGDVTLSDYAGTPIEKGFKDITHVQVTKNEKPSDKRNLFNIVHDLIGERIGDAKRNGHKIGEFDKELIADIKESLDKKKDELKKMHEDSFDYKLILPSDSDSLEVEVKPNDSKEKSRILTFGM